MSEFTTFIGIVIIIWREGRQFSFRLFFLQPVTNTISRNSTILSTAFENKGGLPTSIPEFRDFLQGKHVDPYTGDGAHIWMKVREAFEYDVGYQFKYAKSAARLHSPQRRLIERALRTLSDYIEDELGVDVVIREFMIKRWLVDFTVAVQKS